MDEKKFRNEIISVGLASVVTITLFIILDMFFKICTWNDYFTFDNNYTFMVFFSIVIYSFIVAITRKTFRATAICYILIFFIGIINQLKVSFTGEPLYFSDINFFNNSSDLLQLVTKNISGKFIVQFCIVSFVYGLLLAIIAFVNYKFNIEMKSKKIRIPIIIIDIIILILLFFPTNFTKELYLKIFFNTDNYVDFDSYVTNISFYQRNGLINGMYGVALNNKFINPSNYDEEKLEQMVKDVEIDTQKNGKPNIIVVFSESFWDVDQLTEIEFDKPVTNNFNKLKAEGKFINMISPTYGGMSENVAFEFLTGGSMNYFSVGYIPIMSLYSRKNSDEMPSLVKVLKNNGYKTEIVYGNDYYNSKNACIKIGFDSYDELVKGKQTSLSDKYCTDLLIKRLDEKKPDEKLFYVLETIESHMPFNIDKYNKYDISIKKSKFDENINNTLLCYAQGIYNADQQLGKLYDYIKSYEEPTMLVFFGDHLPFLYTKDRKNVIFELEYFNTGDQLLDNYRLYNTQALVLANYDISNLNIEEYLGVDLLLNSIVNQLDVENDKYYKWLYNTREVLSGANRYVSFDKNGKLYNTKNLTKQMKEVYENKKLMQYKYFINAK